jgi:chromosome segregation ATPase
MASEALFFSSRSLDREILQLRSDLAELGKQGKGKSDRAEEIREILAKYEAAEQVLEESRRALKRKLEMGGSERAGLSALLRDASGRTEGLNENKAKGKES